MLFSCEKSLLILTYLSVHGGVINIFAAFRQYFRRVNGFGIDSNITGES